jgi:hypothetical protein
MHCRKHEHKKGIPHLKKFGLVVHKKNQGLAQKKNSKGKMMIKPHNKVQEIQE